MSKNPIKHTLQVKRNITSKYDAIPARKTVTISNIISLVRAFLAAPIVYSLRNNDSKTALIFILIAILSDMLDGWLARSSNEITVLGKILDPFADSVVIMSVMLFLTVKERIPTFYFTIMLVRYFLISVFGIYMLNNSKVSPQSNKLGKVSVVFTVITVLAFIYPNFFGSSAKPLMIVSIIFMALSLVQYLYEYSRQIIIASREKKANLSKND